MWPSWDDCNIRLRSLAAALVLMAGLIAHADSMQAPSGDPNPDEVTSSCVTLSPDISPVTRSALTSDVWTRPVLTGDWGGTRTNLANHGLTFFGDITQYYQGVAAGGLAQQFRYGGRGDYLIDVDTEKMGLWEGGHVDFRGETRLGQDTNRIDGAVSPSNFAMALPLPNQDVTALTGLQITQDINENLSVFAGKLDLLDGTPASYKRGLRLNYFWNSAMQSNLSRVYLLPSVLGCGGVIRDQGEPVFVFYALDTHFTPATSGFPTLFDNGVVLYGEYHMRTNLLDRPGQGTLGLLYSTATRTSFDFNPYVILPPITSGQSLPTKSQAWTITYRFEQELWASAANSNQRWTWHTDVGLTDGNPNPIRWFANLSIVGPSPIASRADDTIGIGYYHLGVSDLEVLRVLGFHGENGVELFYNSQVTPWFHVTPDLQVLDPARSGNSTALLVGIRARLSF